MELNLRTANADLDEFTYVASHDLKSPLRGIATLLEWIEEDLGETASDDVKNNIKRANTRIHRAETLIEDLLSYARAGRGSGEFTTVNLPEIIDNSINFLDLPTSFNINVDCQLDTIQSPSAPLETVLRNLISNAHKHHDRDHGKIDISVVKSDSHCVFTIVDDGPGIPEGAQERIFKLFQALAKGSSSSSGVGLAVAKRLIDSHGGNIEVQSTNNERGTCFRFFWPRFTRRDLDAQ